MQGTNRRYRLEFGKALNLSDVEDLSDLQLFVPDRELTVQSRVLTDHQIKFDVDKTASGAQNKSEIILTNISNDMWQFINASTGQELYVKLEAATNEAPLQTIALGQVVSVKDTFEGTDRTTEIKFNDGYSPTKESTSDLSFRANEPYRNILRALRDDMRLPWGVYEEPPIRVVSEAPWSFSGNTAEGFRRVAKEINYRYNVTDGKINFVDRHASSLTTVAEYNERSGLIGSPAALDKTAGIKQGSTEQATGIRFKVLLDGRLTVDSLVVIDSEQFEGTYRLSKVKHTGEFRGNPWYTECEALKTPTDIRNPIFDFIGV